MQDISKHINECIDVNSNINQLNESIGESLEVNLMESEKPFKDKDIRFDDEPIKRRKFVLSFIKGLFERAKWDKKGSTNNGMYNDMNLWNITKYVPHILRVVYKNDKRAVRLFTPLIKMVDGLHDYSDAFIKDSNDVFTNAQALDMQNGLNAIKNAEIASYLKTETSLDEWTILSVMVWGKSLENLKASDDEVTKALKPLSKLYDEFEIINNGKRDMVMLRGTSKAYLKSLNELKKKWVKKIEAENK